MNNKNQRARSEVISGYILRMMLDLRLTPAKWSIDVVEEYHAQVPPEARKLAFKVTGDTDAIASANGQTLKRIYDPHAPNPIRMPVDLEEALICCMRQPYRGECEAELQRRLGYLAVRIPVASAGADVHSLSTLSHEFGQALEAVAPTLADGKIDAQDLPYIPKAMRELDDLIGAATSLRARLALQLQNGAAGA